MSKEIWKDIKDYEGLYQISNMGRVRSLERQTSHGHKLIERILTPVNDKDGYLGIRISKDGTAKGFKIHRLVANAFIPNLENKPTVNHIDGNKKNNAVCNLEWATHSENARHAYNTGLQPLKSMKGLQKLTIEQAEIIRTKYTPGSKKYGARALGRKYGVSSTTIRQVLKGKTYKGHK